MSAGAPPRVCARESSRPYSPECVEEEFSEVAPRIHWERMMRRISILLVAALVMVTVVAPGVNASPTNFGGSVESTEHRNNASGKGNFGQCHQVHTAVEGSESSELNPSSQNFGEADCRAAGDLSASGVADCDPADTAAAESRLTFLPVQDREAFASSSCTAV
jgi:hypothetical protein